MNIPITTKQDTCTCVTRSRGAAATRIETLEDEGRVDQQYVAHHARERDKAKAKLIVYAGMEDDREFRDLLMRYVLQERVMSRYTQAQVDRNAEIKALRDLHAL